MRVACSRFLAILLSLAVLLDGGRSQAQSSSELRVDEVDARLTQILQLGLWGAEPGAWRTKAQLMVDPATRLLERRTITVWDPMPSRRHDFTWVPADSAGPQSKIVSAEGQLLWRTRDRPAYDVRSVVATYQGGMANGRPAGFGSFDDWSGLVYAGNWVDGNMQGVGHLKLPNGDEYRGDFLAGRPHGKGRYIDATGEIYQGSFADGRREGRAATTLPSGATYLSYWHDGVELPESREVRLAQTSGPVSGSPSQEDVRIGIIVSPITARMFASDGGEEKKAAYARDALGYTGSNTERGLEIRPNNKRLLGMWKGDTEIQLLPQEEQVYDGLAPELQYGVFSYPKTLLPPVELMMEVQNRSATPMQVVGVYLDVASSATDRQPAVQISVGNDNYCVGIRNHKPYDPKLVLENFGWGRAEKAQLNYTFTDPNSRTRPQSFNQTRAVGTIDETMTVHFEADLKALGVDVTRLASTELKCDLSSEKLDERACLRQLGGPSLFGKLTDKVRMAADDRFALMRANVATGIAGTLSYEWTDAGGAVHERTSPFSATLWLGEVVFHAECGEGGGATRINQQTLEFKLDQSSYRIAIPFRGTVAAGRLARYAFALGAARSSRHDFVVALQLADGRTVRSRPVNLQYFLPSWYFTSTQR